MHNIIIEGATEHNLCNLDVQVVRHAITVISGVSGAGKSTLVLDVILREAQRRFFNTMSLHERKLVHDFARPAVKKISGLSPALILPQALPPPAAGATVGGAAGISELLRILFAALGERKCPQHNVPMVAYSTTQIRDLLLTERATIVLAAPLPATARSEDADWRTLQQKYLRVIIDGKLYALDDSVPAISTTSEVSAVIDVVKIRTGCETRLARSIEQALSAGSGRCSVWRYAGQSLSHVRHFATTASCPHCAFAWPRLEAQHFTANCVHCRGRGSVAAQPCAACHGSGLPKKLHAITIAGHSLPQVRCMTLDSLQTLVRELLAKPQLAKHLRRVLQRLRSELFHLQELGLDYLTLADRLQNLSSGELQKIRIATLINESLNGVIYIFDEPSQGLATTEIEQLWQQFVRLKKRGNTVIVVDHSRIMLEKADHIIELGPGGEAGGKLIANFSFANCAAFRDVSLTAEFLCSAPTNSAVRKHKDTTHPDVFLEIIEPRTNNLQIESVKLLKHGINIVTGVAGAGKSSLLEACLYRSLQQRTAINCRELRGVDNLRQVYFVDRTPLPKRKRSIVATQLDIFAAVRQLFGQLKESQIAGYRPVDFSLSAASGGRCSHCLGLGEIAAMVAWLPATSCYVCDGRRYDAAIAEITWRGLSISDVLDLSIASAVKFFRNFKRMHTILQSADELGLGHLQLGRTTAQLSGGESQRLKLVPCVAKAAADTLLLLDEPGRGLHSADIAKLLRVLCKLRAAGTTLVLIEHNAELIAASDWLVQLGPGGGQYGGRLLSQGAAVL